MEPATKRRRLSSDSNVSVPDTKPADSEQDKRQSLFVRSLPASVTTERLTEHFSQSYPLKHATVVLDPQTKISRGFGFVTFTDAEDARQALAEFNNSVLDGRRIKVEPAEARHRDIAEKIDGKTQSRNTTGEELRTKRQQEREDNQPPKLIVRNLPWSIKTSEDLTKLFLSYGKVKHAVVPNLPAKKDAQAGFGIVILRGRKNAEQALKGVNGKVVDGRTLAVDWAVDKETWQKMHRDEAQPDTAVKPEQQDSVVSNEMNVDAGLAEPKDNDQQAADSDTSEGQGANLVDGAELDEDEDEDEDTDLNDNLDADDIEELAAESETQPKSAASKFNTDDTTVFIRNLPYDVDDDALIEHFRANFGPVRYARVVHDPMTERSRGTGFVCFRHESDAKSCVKDCPKQESAESGHAKQTQSQTYNSVLQNADLDPTGGKYTLSARLLHVTRALPKVEADRRASESLQIRTQKQQSDKRRLYLLSEGTISPGSSLYSTLSKAELDIRASSAKQRQKLVKSNPNLGLSLTRLSIRNLPRWVDGKALKALAREAIVGFASDVKAGLRQPISKDELARDGEAGRLAEKQRKEQGKGVVKQAKIVYESEIIGGKVGEGKGGRSRGYGFVEYWGHRSALMGLRWLNGHLLKKPKDVKISEDAEERGKRLIVEFAIENAQVVQRRGERERRVKDRREKEKVNASNEEEKNDIGKKRKRSDRDKDQIEPAQGAGKRQKTDNGQHVKAGEQEQEEKNKVAARNRIIAQKRQKRKGRKGKA